MAQKTATVEVEHSGETIDVPTEFTRGDLATYFGSIPDEWSVERVFAYEGSLRTEAYLGDETWIETVLHTDDWHETFNARGERGWVAECIDAPADTAEGYDRPGETLWEREADQ